MGSSKRRFNPRPKRIRDYTPRVKSGQTDYQRAYQLLSRVHNFSFPRKRNRNFTPQEKAAIQRQWNRHGEQVQQIREGRSVFLSASEYMRRRYKHEDWPKTNKGIIITRPGTRARFVGKGKRRRVEITLPRPPTQMFQERTIYFDLPPELACDADAIHSYIEMRRSEYGSNGVRLAINGYRGSQLYEPQAWERYLTSNVGQEGKSFVDHVESMCDQMEKYGSTEFPITGFYISVLYDPKTGRRITAV